MPSWVEAVDVGGDEVEGEVGVEVEVVVVEGEAGETRSALLVEIDERGVSIARERNSLRSTEAW